MGITTTQQLTRYYEQYRDTEIAFSKDIIRATSLDPRQVYIKCSGSQWPCIINSTSFSMARIVVGTKGGAYSQLSAKETPLVNLRFCFNPPGNDVVIFQVPGKVTNISPYMNSSELAIITLTFTQRPPDDLIEIVGQLLDANQNALRRKEERIVLNDESRRKLGITKEETIINIQNVPRHCIMREISFSGAKIIIAGLPQFLTGKEAQMRIDFDDPPESVVLKGVVASADIIEGRKDICQISVRFDEATLPLAFKMHVNSYLTTVKKPSMSAAEQLAAQKAKQEKLLEQQKKVQEARAANQAANAAAEKAAEAKAEASAQARAQAATQATNQEKQPATAQGDASAQEAQSTPAQADAAPAAN
ncbi:MAG: PilZ domain-containing protein [Treponema sp.]|nr:PilZ domain-containing protein [Treponema sp.]